jgi:hypothetical protein
MAAWYNSTNSCVLDISQFDYDANRMLETLFRIFLNSSLELKFN